MTQGKSGIYNIVDDEPIPYIEWLPFVAKLLDAPVPKYLNEEDARNLLGDLFVYTMTEQKGVSNLKAKKVLGWEPQIGSRKEGFKISYTSNSL